MTRYKVTVPPTMEQGSYTTTVTTRGGWFSESIAKQALWDYNSARAHDGLPPLSRMPKGTRYEPADSRFKTRKR
jgi:hypothetical protein